MFPFWDTAIKPVLQAISPKRAIEIGALRGETTELVLEALGPDCELHVIDPVPEFDPSEHERRFAGRYVFHRDLSHNVLPGLPHADVALIDGDHNWYTVYHELRMLAATAADNDAELPVCLMHDVCWPYGRRDLYYDPGTIPAEFRQPHERRGMRLGVSNLSKHGGMNRTLDNAVEEGGERNGVMTGLDDFLAEFPHAVRVLVIPIYFGLAIVAEERTLERLPALSRVIDELHEQVGDARPVGEAPASDRSGPPLLELAEQLRLETAVAHHDHLAREERRLNRSNGRYLDLLKVSLTNEHAIDAEVRLHYALQCIEQGTTPDLARLAMPTRQDRRAYNARLDARRGGVSGGPDTAPLFVYAPSGRRRLDALHDALDAVRAAGVGGDLIDVGVRGGGAAMLMRGYTDIWNLGDRTVWLADRFDARPHHTGTGLVADVTGVRPDLNTVREGFDRYGLLDDHVRFLHGEPGEMIGAAPFEELAVVRLDATLPGGLAEPLAALYDRLAVGGRVLVDHLEDADPAELDEARLRLQISEPLEHPESGLAAWTKTAACAPSPAATATTQVAIPRGAAVLGAAPDDACDLTVVVVFHNMAREAKRTLHSLSRAYQADIDELDYEVIAVDNGSDDDQRLSPGDVAAHGAEFRLISITGDDAHASPAHALNVALSQARGRNFALMIDGAHVLTPRVLHFGMAGLRTMRPAAVATQQWYVGPGQQHDVAAEGYDQEFENRLFDEIEWPSDGYKLFDIGHFIGDRDWFDPMWESNCLFVNRAVLRQIGAFDESFDMAGGGYVNLDLFERVTWTPKMRTVTILGEGSFHQIHGGTTTNHVDPAARQARVREYGRHYEELRGKPFQGAPGPYHYVGLIHERSKRTRARRRLGTAFTAVVTDDADSKTLDRAPIPDELADAFTAAYWQSGLWRDTKWMGRGVRTTPADLILHHDLICDAKPDWIIQLGGVVGGGFVQFLSHVCSLARHGSVLAVDAKAAPSAPTNERLQLLREDPADDATMDHIRELVGTAPNGLVLFGRAKRSHLTDLFERYSPLVGAGSYAVFHHSIVNGNPVWAAHGPGPTETARRIVQERDDFVLDPVSDRYGLAFSRKAVLRRIA